MVEYSELRKLVFRNVFPFLNVPFWHILLRESYFDLS